MSKPTHTKHYDPRTRLTAVKYGTMTLATYKSEAEADAFLAAINGATILACCTEAARAGYLDEHLETWNKHRGWTDPRSGLESSLNG